MERSESVPPEHPRWDRLCADDLRSLPRLLTLYQQAVQLKLASDGEAGRLAFVAAAEHARFVGESNPCGLFRTIVVKRLWHFVTQEAEDSARKRLLTVTQGRPQRCGTANRSPKESVQSILSAIVERCGLQNSDRHKRECRVQEPIGIGHADEQFFKCVVV
jgi:hypothetical protein